MTVYVDAKQTLIENHYPVNRMYIRIICLPAVSIENILAENTKRKHHAQQNRQSDKHKYYDYVTHGISIRRET